MDKWICTECGESEGGDIHCEAKVEIGKPEFCLISGDEAEWHLVGKVGESELYIDTDGMRRNARSIKEGQGTRIGSMAKMLIDCCYKIDQQAAEIAKLKEEIKEYKFQISEYIKSKQGESDG